MAKTRMICPFSGKLCKECPFYIGRHYFLCFCEKYRGHLNEEGEVTKVVNLGTISNKKFEMPSIIIPTSAIDPFIDIWNDNEKEV